MDNNAKFYKCDPDKNSLCDKKLCQRECFYTTDKDCSVDGVPYTVDTLNQEK